MVVARVGSVAFDGPGKSDSGRLPMGHERPEGVERHTVLVVGHVDPALRPWAEAGMRPRRPIPTLWEVERAAVGRTVRAVKAAASSPAA